MSRPLAGRVRAAVLAAALLGAGLAAPAAGAATLALTQYVNPFIGTDNSNSPNPVPGGAGGSTYPGAVVPFGMVQFSPDTPTASPSGYRYSDTSIEEFSLTHFNGAGCANNEDLGLLPITGAIGTSPGTGWTGYAGRYTKANESAAPGYYKNTLDNYNTTVELSATQRSGFMKLTYPNTTSARLLVNTGRSATGSRNGSISISGSQLTGSVTGGGFCGSSKTYQIFYVIQFDRAPSGFGTWLGGTVSAGSASTSGTNSGGYVTFDTSGNTTVQAKVGISFVSLANAQANLAAESPGFDFTGIRSAADTSWNNILNRVQVTGGAAADLQKFYTALYHVFQNPNIASDTNGQYRGFDQAVHTASHTVYQNYSGWDIYRSWAALIGLVAPGEASDIAKSMVLDGQQGGLLPKWSHNSNEHFVMTGDPGPIIVGSMYAFGVRGFDTAAALTLMDKSASGGTTQGQAIRGRESGYLSRHYVYEDPSDSLEYSASDFAVAQFAKALGDTTKYSTYMQRAQWWQNVFGTDSGYVQPRGSDGTWAWPVVPPSNSGYTEGNPSQYTWMVPYNYQGVINLMGGRQTAVQRLDHHFTQLNGGLTQPYFYIGNEPEHGVPWAYNYAAHPEGTSSAVRRVMNESFTTGPGGLPGNDDLGATSAWYVFAALGMYPATPGADVLALHGPLFPAASITRPSGTIRITGSGAGQGAQYVQSVSVNGTSTTKSWIRYGDIAGASTLSYTMGSSPSAWGTNPSDVPPSYNDGFTPPAAAPELGTNLALGKTATGSATCNSAETPAKAVDGSLANNSKFCSTAATKFLQVDLGSAQNVSSFVVKHAGLGGETTGWNTGAFTIQTSTDGSTWTTVASVTGSRASRTYHPITTRSARYVKLNLTTPANDGNGAARIYEFEVYR
ncbi:GH92 family glycosyl hydrolase [Amycolatopsis sp. Hca4]|uniref:GH92 family glycosyl hydrolase n=1 Tax=Amycolatopsis sp. Hca4 TaxID=2742131 RepID=UPI001590B5ED|nr:GH92 family glycosyl hydrolase [Amycolatopsis sp. Hca4]QKV78914.1 glycoside hydrolase family 92 protein [Amycolatopsis sp. Hca4]